MAGKIKTCCRRRNVPLKKCKSLLPDNWVFNPQQLVISLWMLEEGYMINGKLASMITQPLLHLHIKYLQLLLTLVPKLKTIMITAAIWQHVSWWTILLMPIIPLPMGNLPIILVITIILISNPTMTTTMTSMASASIPLSLWLPRPRQPPVFTLWHLCDFLMPDKQNTQHTQKCSTTTTPFHFSGSFYHFHFIHITYVCIEHLFWKLSPFLPWFVSQGSFSWPSRQCPTQAALRDKLWSETILKILAGRINVSICNVTLVKVQMYYIYVSTKNFYVVYFELLEILRNCSILFKTMAWLIT